MYNIARKLLELVHALPVIILATLIQVIIGYAVGTLVMGLLMPTSFGHDHKYIVLGIVVLSAIGSFAWIKWYHKIQGYIGKI